MPHTGMLVLVQGLAGSGKSHLIKLLAHDFCIEENFAISDEVENTNITNLINNLSRGRRCIVSERKYRSRIEREQFIARITSAIEPAPLVRYVCFENNLDAANHNCLHRTNKRNDPDGLMHIQQNNHDTVDYEIPEDAILVRIYRIPVPGTGSEK